MATVWGRVSITTPCSFARSMHSIDKCVSWLSSISSPGCSREHFVNFFAPWKIPAGKSWTEELSSHLHLLCTAESLRSNSRYQKARAAFLILIPSTTSVRTASFVACASVFLIFLSSVSNHFKAFLTFFFYYNKECISCRHSIRVQDYTIIINYYNIIDTSLIILIQMEFGPWSDEYFPQEHDESPNRGTVNHLYNDSLCPDSPCPTYTRWPKLPCQQTCCFSLKETPIQ